MRYQGMTQSTNNKNIDDYLAAAESYIDSKLDGCDLDYLEVTDGEFIRFSTEGDKFYGKSGFALVDELDDGHISVLFGCWRDGETYRWNSKSGGGKLAKGDRKLLQAKREEQSQKQAEKNRQCREQSQQLWSEACPLWPDHGYVEAKQLNPDLVALQVKGTTDTNYVNGGLLVSKLLLVPIQDFDGVLWSLQKISEVGDKFFLPGTKKKGNFHLINPKGLPIDAIDNVYLCEGFATGISVYEYYEKPVFVAFDTGNLLPVADGFRKRFDTQLTIVADNDRKTPGNPGLTAAKNAAAKVAGCKMIIPGFPDDAPLEWSDFNDWVNFAGVTV